MSKAYPVFTLGALLSAEQIAHFQTCGFLHFRNFIGREQVAALIAATTELEKTWIANDGRKVNGVPIKYGKGLDGRRIRRRVIYIPVISGKYTPKNAHSATPLHQRLARFTQ